MLKGGSKYGIVKPPKPPSNEAVFSKAQILSRVHDVPTIRFADQTLTSASALVLFQVIFSHLDLRRTVRLRIPAIPDTHSG